MTRYLDVKSEKPPAQEPDQMMRADLSGVFSYHRACTGNPLLNNMGDPRPVTGVARRLLARVETRHDPSADPRIPLWPNEFLLWLRKRETQRSVLVGREARTGLLYADRNTPASTTTSQEQPDGFSKRCTRHSSQNRITPPTPEAPSMKAIRKSFIPRCQVVDRRYPMLSHEVENTSKSLQWVAAATIDMQ
ncbi:hypothetical protein CIB48_g11806 [Xylaria polymorpha]|nr:hypothetical protein CIB48_g11806 [Xylaria polymorpha]